MPSHFALMRRRDLLAGLTVLGTLPRGLCAAVSEPGPAMMPEYLAARLNPIAEKWRAEIVKLQTPAQIRGRNRFVREKEIELLGGFPEKTPLHARVVKTTERNGYRIENVMFQSRPDFWVTANLWVPTRGAGPYPGVLSPCGHYDISRFYPDYQLAYRNMVENGFVVLSYDPMGQGERRSFWNPETNQAAGGITSTTEHSLACHLLRLLGEDVNEYFVWDGMRGIDYLLSRPEVDPKRIGCAGHSGGGTQAMYLCCADERVACIVINEGGLGHQWPIDPKTKRLSPADGEQNLFGAAMFGIDSAELHAAISPRPLLVTVEHFNPSFNDAAADVKKRYELLGAADRFSTVEAQAPHAWTKKLRIASTDWLCRFFYNHPGPTEEPDYQPETQETLRCVPNGSLLYSGFGSIFTRINQQAANLQLAAPRNTVGTLRQLLKYRRPETPISARDGGPGRVFFDSEPGITLTAMVTRAPNPQGLPIVYLDDEGAQAVHESGLASRMAEKGHTVVAVDVRGIGSTAVAAPASRRSEFAHVFNVETWMSYQAWQLDDSLIGMRVADAVRAVDYALSLQKKPGKVRVIGKGIGALWALFAAALDPRVESVVCHGGLLSYQTMAASDRTLHGADIVIAGVLKYLDLPDVAAAIASRPLRLIDPVDAMKQPVETATAQKAYQRAAEAYTRKGAADRFRILHVNDPVGLADLYLG
ncbi:MAG TPA: acetylxylan esterase [Bryobacteraceae bacterium]|nr:acetylxylan esterase [Bryobacteraceae bacterium]